MQAREAGLRAGRAPAANLATRRIRNRRQIANAVEARLAALPLVRGETTWPLCLSLVARRRSVLAMRWDLSGESE
jgi:hypothetical protein